MSPIRNHLVIASRGSRLALTQARIVSDLVTTAVPALDVEIKTIATTGDRDQRPYAQIGGKGLFTTEVERAVIEGTADIAVHSAKDLTAELADGCAIVCVPARASVHDVVVGAEGSTGFERLAALPPGSRVGTSSMRRRALLYEARPDLEPVELRGNLDTRLQKVADGLVDAAILAAAGIERLLGEVADAGPLDPSSWVPAPAQGALAVEARAERTDLVELFASIEDPGARAEIECERAFAATLEGGCSVPLGCLARVDGSGLVAHGFLGGPVGSQSYRDRISGGIHEAQALGKELAQAILACGGAELLEELRDTDAPPVEEP